MLWCDVGVGEEEDRVASDDTALLAEGNRLLSTGLYETENET